jgi:Resolvase, N terminal domain
MGRSSVSASRARGVQVSRRGNVILRGFIFDCFIVRILHLRRRDVLANLSVMQAKNVRFVAYFRVSTDRQGRSGLGLEAQAAAVRHYLASVGGTLIVEHTEVERGKRSDRPELLKAMAACRRHKAKLVIAKLDRLSRNVAFIAALMDEDTEFVVCDNPHATRLTLHILAAIAEHERDINSPRRFSSCFSGTLKSACSCSNPTRNL